MKEVPSKSMRRRCHDRGADYTIFAEHAIILVIERVDHTIGNLSRGL